MNWVDIIIVGILFGFILLGYGKSLFFEVFDFASFLLAFLVSLRFYNFAADQFDNLIIIPHTFANVLGFIAIWYVVESLLYILVLVIFKNYQTSIDIVGEKFIGTIPSFLRGLVIIAVVLVLVATFPIQPRIKKDVQSSQLGSLILHRTYQLETPLKNIFGGLANDTLTFLTIKPKSTERVNLGFRNDQFEFDESLEMTMLALVNQERVKAGVEVLSYDSRLQQVARSHSADMFKRGYFSHYSPEGRDVGDRIQEVSVHFLVIGENLAFAPTLELAHQGLMNSPGHKANILSPDYHRIGIGAASSEDYGIMFTQVFKD